MSTWLNPFVIGFTKWAIPENIDTQPRMASMF